MSDWKSSEDGTTKEQQKAEEKRRERPPMTGGTYSRRSFKEPLPPIPQMEATKFKKYEKAEYMKARRKPMDSLPKK